MRISIRKGIITPEHPIPADTKYPDGPPGGGEGNGRNAHPDFPELPSVHGPEWSPGGRGGKGGPGAATGQNWPGDCAMNDDYSAEKS